MFPHTSVSQKPASKILARHQCYQINPYRLWKHSIKINFYPLENDNKFQNKLRFKINKRYKFSILIDIYTFYFINLLNQILKIYTS